MTSKSPKELTGVERIAVERARQVSEENYDALHDDEHDAGELALAAACYAAYVAERRIFVMTEFAAGPHFSDPWPWDVVFDKRTYDGNTVKVTKLSSAKAVRMLEKAGALIAAEIDRLLRAR